MMLAVRRTATAVVQLFGNVMKLIFYVDLWLRPQKRYCIPSFAPALARPRSTKAIPRIVWLTNFTNQVTLAIYFNYLHNRLFAPTCEFRFCGDDDRVAFIKENYSADILDCYMRLQLGAAQADLWRSLVLLKHGGIYLDIDATLTWPPELLINATQTELLVMTREEGLTNYLLATAPATPLLQAICDKIVANIKEDKLRNVFTMTGPGAVQAVAGNFNPKVEPYFGICKQGLFSNKDFQYPNDRRHYWGSAQQHIDIVRKPLPPEA